MLPSLPLQFVDGQLRTLGPFTIGYQQYLAAVLALLGRSAHSNTQRQDQGCADW